MTARILRASEITLPSSLKYIGEFASRNTSIKFIAANMRYIPIMAFIDMPSLERVEFSDNHRVIECGAFMGCVNLKRASLPDSLKDSQNVMLNDAESLLRFALVIIQAYVAGSVSAFSEVRLGK